jgi:hypothetical protein
MVLKRRFAVWLFGVALAWGGWLPASTAAPAAFADATATGSRTDYTLTTFLTTATEDQNKSLRVYLVALVPGANGTMAYARTSQAWAMIGEGAIPEVMTVVGAESPLSLSIVNSMDVQRLGGTAVYLGYGREGTSAPTPFDEMLAAGRYRLIHRVASGWPDTGVGGTGALSAVASAGLTQYFRNALGPNGATYLGKTMMPLWGVAVAGSAAPTAPVSADAAPAYSGTTLQESGVDEADLVKSDGSAVFSLDPAEKGDTRRGLLRRQRLNAAAADAALASGDNLILPLSAGIGATGLYLDDVRRQLVAIGQGGFYGDIYAAWFMPLYWTRGATEVVLVDYATPDRMTARRTLRINAQLIGSRRIGATLYLVLRNYPELAGLDPWWPTDKAASNQAVLDTLQAAALLPAMSVDGGPAQPLVETDACLVQNDNAALSADIITVVGIDLAATEHRHAARCFTGGAEAFYMSTQSLYLATTRSTYTYSGAFPAYPQQTSTDLHKFSLEGLNILYRGSGSVTGHLGFDQNRKSFRMGEHDGLLRIITQTERSFGGWGIMPAVAMTATATARTDSADPVDPASASPGRLTILRENSGALASVAVLPNTARPAPLGKPGEQLYASRFLGSRGYLVTYRLTDPLYVLDLSNPSDPKIAGELEISGYSDYLFPLGENLLLGVGKDAVSDGTSGDGRFAWYQGVKVALLDVSDPAMPREAARAVIGRRGTDATVLHDHHGIALQTRGGKVRIGLPVRLHDTPSPYPYYNTGKPSDYYDFTRNELERFEVDLDTRQLSTFPALKGQQTNYDWSNHNDRALLWEDQMHYYQDGLWTSSPW